jgi:hypothetical protein
MKKDLREILAEKPESDPLHDPACLHFQPPEWRRAIWMQAK